MPKEEVKIVGLSAHGGGGKTNWKIIGAIIGIIILALGVIAGIILVRQQQNISEEAQACLEECPGADGVLRNCHPPLSDGTAQESVCNTAGLIEFCGTRNFCCPSAGAPWTTNLTLCATPAPTTIETTGFDASGSPTPTSTPTSTATPTASVSPTPTATSGIASGSPTATPTASTFPVPETSTSWPTILGAGIGIIVVLTSLVVFAL